MGWLTTIIQLSKRSQCFCWTMTLLWLQASKKAPASKIWRECRWCSKAWKGSSSCTWSKKGSTWGWLFVPFPLSSFSIHYIRSFVSLYLISLCCHLPILVFFQKSTICLNKSCNSESFLAVGSVSGHSLRRGFSPSLWCASRSMILEQCRQRLSHITFKHAV